MAKKNELPAILVDTREQTPFDFLGHPTKTETLPFGDYSLEGFIRDICIERKSLPDLIACVGRERDRFEKELLALRGYRFRAVIIEADLKEIFTGRWRGEIQPAHVLGSINGWRAKLQIEFIYAGNPQLGAKECFTYLRKSHDYILDCTRRFL